MVFPFKSAFILVLLINTVLCEAQELVFFIHPSGLEQKMSENLIRDIYLKKMRFWKDGQKIRPLDHAVGSSDRNKLNSSILGKTETELTEYWIQEKQQTGSIQPLQVQNPEMLIYLVETMSGSLGYIANTPENKKLLETKKVKVLQYE